MYNLMEENWLSVLYRDGRPATLNLIEVMEQAHSLQLAYSNPMDRVSVFRFILALLYWCYDKTKIDMPDNNNLPTQWITFLTDNRGYFDLLGDGPRFYQDIKVRHMRPSTDLLHEVPTGNNFAFFNHTIDYISGFCLPCCVLGLLRFTIYAASGRPDLKSSINGMPPFYVIPWGDCLLETIKLNWAPSGPMGDPAWVDNTVDPKITPTPLLVGLTALARRSRLHEPVAGDAACAACGGRGSMLIYSCDYQTAGDITNPAWIDPHICYDDNGRKPLKTKNLVSEKPLLQDRPWQNPISCYTKEIVSKPGGRLLCVGVSVNQAKIEDSWEHTLTVPVLQGEIDSLPVLSLSGLIRRQIGSYEKQRYSYHDKKLNPGRNNKYSLSQSLLSTIAPHVVHESIKATGGLFTSNEGFEQNARESYRPALKIASRSLLSGTLARSALFAAKFVNMHLWLDQTQQNPQDDQNCEDDHE